jgi:carbohydrate kinase (thermoresistant glucokinase family)
MGVSGCGKSTVGAALARRLGWRFLDADDFHPAANVAKMRAGVPLTDEDRWPWLDRIAGELHALSAAAVDAVLACSALRQAYRDRLGPAAALRFVHLRGDAPTIERRLAARQHRYMPATLLASQFATLEPPAGAVEVDVRDSVAAQVDAVVAALRLATAGPLDGRPSGDGAPALDAGSARACGER